MVLISLENTSCNSFDRERSLSGGVFNSKNKQFVTWPYVGDDLDIFLRIALSVLT
jgi:hypothetical protein